MPDTKSSQENPERTGWQSQLSKFANVMLAALLLLRKGFYRYSAITFSGRLRTIYCLMTVPNVGEC